MTRATFGNGRERGLYGLTDLVGVRQAQIAMSMDPALTEVAAVIQFSKSRSKTARLAASRIQPLTQNER